MNPCGAAQAETIEQAWQKAFEADPVSIYGGIVAVNRCLTEEIALGMKPIFLEIVLAPDFTPAALEVLSSKKNLRVLKVDMTPTDAPVDQYVGVTGGLLVQHLDTQIEHLNLEQVATEKRPTPEMLADLQFAWNIVKHVKSNAIVVAQNLQTRGVGAGQMNRVGSAEIALRQATANGADTDRLVLASDGFLPFDDTVELAAKFGIKAIVQPGGSIRDTDCINKANEKNISMLLTGVRHFKH